ncbi:MAG TPA: hypothetical protein VGL91_23840 [Acidobacteriota bacterium]
MKHFAMPVSIQNYLTAATRETQPGQSPGLRCRGSAVGWLGKEGSNESLLTFVFDAREQFCPETAYCLRAIEGESRIHLATLEVTRPAPRLQDWPDFAVKIDLRDDVRLRFARGRINSPVIR